MIGQRHRTMENFPDNFLIFGCGNMAGAMLTGWIKAGVEPTCFTVIDPIAKELPNGVRHFTDAQDVTERFAHVLIGIKPQMLAALGPKVAEVANSDAAIYSMLAGARTASLQKFFPERNIIRLMPNLAAAIGKSPIGLWSDRSAIERDSVSDIFAPLGSPIWLESEEQMDAVTALVGSGPAFVYRVIDALGKAGIKCGLDPATSAQLAKTMVDGAAALAASSSENPEQLAARVTSKGGTTAAGLAILDTENALDQLIEATLEAATKRGQELAILAEQPES
jgi:pyrroline-5-carboxylate reductase